MMSTVGMYYCNNVLLQREIAGPN